MKPNYYTILPRAIEDGIACGYRMAHKHDDNPDPDTIQSHIYSEVMNAICEVFNFDDPSVDSLIP